MANKTFIAAAQSLWGANTWEGHCIAALRDSAYQWDHGLVDGNGQPMSTLNSSTWGINMRTCNEYCNNNIIPFPLFNFQSLSNCLTNYLLPWLALTAQLPYETGNPWSNVMSFCLAVGSPALVTYSLAVTIMNRSWARDTFKRLRKEARKSTRGYGGRISAAGYLLQEGQQVPLRASQEKGWLSSLVVLKINSDWWKRLETRIKSTRRGVTASLVAQMLFAAIAYLFTVITSFIDDFGSPTIALQIASGSLWIWLIPVIAGWITVGTQIRPGTILVALKEDNPAHRALEPTTYAERTQVGRNLTQYDEQQGLNVRGGLNPIPHRSNTGHGTFDTPSVKDLKVLSWLGMSIEGDGEREGPIYNYARLFTWSQCAVSLQNAFSATIETLEEARQSIDTSDAGSQGDEQNLSNLLSGDSKQVSQQCGLLKNPVLAYTQWSQISSVVWNRMVVGVFAAFFVQWGTTGASILIAYLTPTKGVGCRSASYILYGVLGTAAFSCLLVSMLLSHEAMLRYQDEQEDGTLPNLQKHDRTPSHGFICGTAAILRRLGKLFASVNAVWLIASSILEFVGVFDCCWCLGDFIGKGNDGWVVLFKNGTDLANGARGAWYGGVILTVMICLISYGCFLMGSRESGDD